MVKLKGSKAAVVLNALDMGIPVKLPVYGGMTELVMKDKQVCQILDREDTKTGKKDKVYMPMDVSVNQFINMCEDMSYDDSFIMSCNTTLNRIRERKSKGRSGNERSMMLKMADTLMG